MNLSDRTILVTGATGGICQQLVPLLAADWATLVLVGRNTRKLKELTRNIAGKHHIIAADLSSKSGRSRLIKTIKRKKLKIDILINGAGIGIYKKAHDFIEKDWSNSYELNVLSPFFLWQGLRPQLTVNIGSCSALQYKPGRALYNSTKAAFRALTLCLASEYPDELVHITLDSTLTSFGSLSLDEKKRLASKGKQYLDPQWVAKAIYRIIHDEQRSEEYVLSPDCYENCGIWQKP